MTKHEIMDRTATMLAAQHFTVIAKDDTRPWGGFFVIEEEEAARFIQIYFPGIPPGEFAGFSKLSPKILIVAPHRRLSWQYHFRRSEIWRVIDGPVGIIRSRTDEEGGLEAHAPEEIIRLDAGERHRLIGLENWGVVAEIWQHTDPDHPSDEADIVRLQDDFGRQ